MKLIFAVLDVSLTMGLTRCHKTEGFLHLFLNGPYNSAARLRALPVIDYHLRLIGKRVVELNFFRWVLRLKRYEQISVQNRRLHSNEGQLTQNFRFKGWPPLTILFLNKLG